MRRHTLTLVREVRINNELGMKYTLLYLSIAVGTLAIASCSSDDDMSVGSETSQTVNAPTNDGPVSWLVQAKTAQELQEVEEAISAIRGAGYTYRDNESYCVGTDMEVFNMRRLRDMEEKYNTSYIADDYMPSTEQKFFYSESVNELKDQL